MTEILTKVEGPRGCGYRKPGGLYFVSSGLGSPCLKLPIPLEVCPCCGTGIKPSRGFTWINSNLFASVPCGKAQDPPFLSVAGNRAHGCGLCPLSVGGQKMGLLWIGEKFYKDPIDFTHEADFRGISRRISQIPHDFDLGKTWICLAHRRALSSLKNPPRIGETNEIEYRPGIFHAFRPSAIEYVVTGKETDEDLERLKKRGITPVKVVRDVDLQTSFDHSLNLE